MMSEEWESIGGTEVMGCGPQWFLPGETVKIIDRQAFMSESSFTWNLTKKLYDDMVGESRFTDMVFEIGTGPVYVKAHTCVICCGSLYFEKMFTSGMVEPQFGLVHVPSWVTVDALKALLEWIYLGRCGEMCKKTDLRLLWVLAEMYCMDGIKEWLCKYGVGYNNLGAVMEFGLLNRKYCVCRSELIEKCKTMARDENVEVTTWGYIHDCAVVIEELLQARMGSTQNPSRKKVRDGLQLVKCWCERSEAKMNVSEKDVERMIKKLDMYMLSRKELEWIQKRGSQFLNFSFKDIYDRKCRGDCVKDSVFGITKRYYRDRKIRRIAIDCQNKRLAIVFYIRHQVCVYDLENGNTIFLIRLEQFRNGIPSGVAFHSNGNLYVSDIQQHRILVFDRLGQLIKEFGEFGIGLVQFNCPIALAFGGNENLLVVDHRNDRVLILTENGEFVQIFGEGMFHKPSSICFTNQDGGKITIIDSQAGNIQIRMFNGEGEYVMSIGSLGNGIGEFQEPIDVAFGPEGEIYVSDSKLGAVQVFNHNGEFVQKICRGGKSNVNMDNVFGIAVDDHGRLFAAKEKIVEMLEP